MTSDKFIEGLKVILADVPDAVAKMSVEKEVIEAGMDVIAEIPSDDPNGFKIIIQFQKDYEVNVIADECVVDFFLTGKAKDSEKDEITVKRAFDLIRRLLGPQLRVHNYYRGGLLYKSFVERESNGQWLREAGYRRVLYGARLFGVRSERYFQNHLAPI